MLACLSVVVCAYACVCERVGGGGVGWALHTCKCVRLMTPSAVSASSSMASVLTQQGLKVQGGRVGGL